MTPDRGQWAFEVHPEVCFWVLAGEQPMVHNKKTKDGAAERIAALRPVFPEIGRHLANRPPRVGADDLLDVHDLFRYLRDWSNLKFIDSLLGWCTNAPAPPANEG
jgi:predicted RNase H-like nuclease